MPVYHLEYHLENGYVHNWLVAGPQAIPVSDLDLFEEKDRRSQITRHYREEGVDISQPPVDRGTFQIGDAELVWHYCRCLDDHFVDVSTFCHTWHYLRAWAYAQVESPSSHQATFVLTTNGPADLWLNGQHVHRQEHFDHPDPRSVPFQATLEEGRNEILLSFEEAAARECPYVMALQMAGLSQDASRGLVVRVPTPVRRTARRQMFEQAFEHAYVERNVVHKGDTINLRWADDLATLCNLVYQVQDWRRRIYVDGKVEAQPSALENVGHIARLWERAYSVALQPPSREYYEHNMRYERRIPVHVLDTAYSEVPYGTYEERRQETLENAAKRESSVFAEIAKFELGRWDEVNTDLAMDAIEKINQSGDGAVAYLVGLLGAMCRYLDKSAFPEQLRHPLEECVLNFRYGPEEPANSAVCYASESHSILSHTSRILVGQLYPERTFADTATTGEWHRQEGERMALSWLRERGTGGFGAWDSNCCFEEDVLALSHLADLAQDVEVSELAAILLDKLLFTVAVNSYKGAFGSSHGRTCASMVQGSQLESTSGISRLMWGMGVYNHQIMGTVSLACSGYELPPIISDVATDLPEEMWNRERHLGDLNQSLASGLIGSEVNKVTYKTPDYMLCSAQDYHPGERGCQQHVWQATMGPDAVVFVNHPAYMSDNGAHRPGFWLGNYALPRVAQWQDVLVAVHKLPENDWMGFTHAYFPICAFDEYVTADNADGHPWAFARQGSGYLALTAALGLELVTRGPSAYRELRSYGQHNVWLCQMGRAAVDDSFDEFQEKVLAADLDWQGLGLRCATLRGEMLSFGWEGPLIVDGEEQPITDFKHYENPYCVADLPASQMEIRFGDYLLRLDFS